MRKLFIFLAVFAGCAAAQCGSGKLVPNPFGSVPPLICTGGGGGGAATIACAGVPGNTAGTSGQLCKTTNGTIFACNSATCAVASDWVVSSAPYSLQSTSSPVTVTDPGDYYNKQATAASAITFNLPAITNVGIRYCFGNAASSSANSAAGNTGAITLQLPASTTIDFIGTTGSAAGTLVSAGALGDFVCVKSVSTTQYKAFPGSGSWTNN